MSDLLSRITINPDQCFGKPCIRGTRMRVVDVLEMLAGGAAPDEILEDFDFLEMDDIRASLNYAFDYRAAWIPRCPHASTSSA